MILNRRGRRWHFVLLAAVLAMMLSPWSIGSAHADDTGVREQALRKATVVLKVQWDAYMQRVDDKTGRKQSFNAGPVRRICTGFAVGAGYIVTASSCVNPDSSSLRQALLANVEKRYFPPGDRYNTAEELEVLKRSGVVTRSKAMVSAYAYTPNTNGMSPNGVALTRVYPNKTDTADMTPGGHVVFRADNLPATVVPLPVAFTEPAVGDKVEVVGFDGSGYVEMDFKASEEALAVIVDDTITNDNGESFSLGVRYAERMSGGMVLKDSQVVGLVDEPAEGSEVSMLTDLNRLKTTAHQSGVQIRVATPSPSPVVTANPSSGTPASVPPSSADVQQNDRAEESGMPVGLTIVIVLVVIVGAAGISIYLIRKRRA